MSKERTLEYAELSAFLDLYATHILKIDPSDTAHPTNTGKLIVAAVGEAKALVGLRQAINDSLEGLEGLTPELVAQLDQALRHAGIVTLTELRRRHSRKYTSILKRGHIRNETEYYMVKAVMDDCGGNVPETELTLLRTMLQEFEQAANNSFKGMPLRGTP